MNYTVTLLLFEKSPKHKNIKQITVELELGFEEDDDEEDMMLLVSAAVAMPIKAAF